MQQAASDPMPVTPEEASAPHDLAPLRATRDDGSVDPAFRGALDAAVALHRHLVRLRAISARMVELQRDERVAFHASSIGEEAAIVGAALAARREDWVLPGLREWGAALVRGLPVAAYVHHAFGSSLDPAKGHASPDHPPARDVRVVPASGVVGAHVAQAVGVAWAARAKKDDVVALALFGDGATSTGDFHNAMNFAGVFKAPAVLVCRNNGRAGATPSARQTKTETIAEKAVAYGVASARVDGGDALAVLAVVRAAIARAAAGKGPTLIEAVTSPLAPEGDLLAIGDADPIARLARVIDREGLGPVDAAAIASEARAEVDAAVDEALRAGPPPRATMFDDVYATVPPHLAAERDQMKEIGS